MKQGAPWDFNPAPEVLQQWRTINKNTRRERMAVKNTNWNVYSAVGGAAPNLRVSSDNPPAALRGIVVDYDMVQSVESIVELLKQLEPTYLPNFIEVTLSKKARLVWVFEREIMVPDSYFCAEVLNGFVEKLGAGILLPGFDKNSVKPAEVWTNGGAWYTVSDKPMPWETVFGILCSISEKLEFGAAEIPLPVVAEEIEKRFPGRWRGPFEVNNTGVRFWDETADCPTGCQVKPDGMLCFTGKTAFMSWDAILGASWCNEQRALNLGKAAGEVYFDGRTYWEQRAGIWVSVSREDVLLQLKARGISAKVGRGQTASDAERILHYIQSTNRVSGVAPLINYRPGLVTLDGNRILNTSTIRALEPAEKENVIPEDFPWLWNFLNGLFDRPDLHSLDHFLAWLRRAYLAGRDYRKAMGQAVFLCGPRENGKSLLCYHIVKPLLGNRLANPYDYFVGLTPFNSDLFETPLLAINDEEATTREDTRQKFIARIKSFVVNPSHAYHPKFCNRINIEWTGRIFITLNDDPASVGLLPEVNHNTHDKLMYFASRPFQGQWDETHVTEGRIAAELPFFARWLLNWNPPLEVINPGRMGVKSFFDPRILEFSKQQGPAYVLLELIKIWCLDGPYWNDDKTEWVGTASELINQFSIVDHLHTLLREWNSQRAAKSLTTLARVSNTGISFIEGKGQRQFKIDRKQIVNGE